MTYNPWIGQETPVSKTCFLGTIDGIFAKYPMGELESVNIGSCNVSEYL
jgi:hypothetical protein